MEVNCVAIATKFRRNCALQREIATRNLLVCAKFARNSMPLKAPISHVRCGPHVRCGHAVANTKEQKHTDALWCNLKHKGSQRRRLYRCAAQASSQLGILPRPLSLARQPGTFLYPGAAPGVRYSRWGQGPRPRHTSPKGRAARTTVGHRPNKHTRKNYPHFCVRGSPAIYQNRLCVRGSPAI
jgi:hypothetical protein